MKGELFLRGEWGESIVMGSGKMWESRLWRGGMVGIL